MRRMVTISNLMKALALVAVAALVVGATVRADSGQILGPDFQAWDLKFGLISNESGDWISHAEQNGTLGDREPSCKVYDETSALVFPLTPEPAAPGLPPDVASWFRAPIARYGLTFEYATTKPNVPYILVITYPPNPDYPKGGERKSVSNGWLPGLTTGKTGRFCFYQWSNEQEAQMPGTHCYQMTIEGVALPQICADVISPNGVVDPNAQ